MININNIIFKIIIKKNKIVDPIFCSMRSHSKAKLTFYLFDENMIFRKDLESLLIFVLFMDTCTFSCLKLGRTMVVGFIIAHYIMKAYPTNS